MLKDLMRVHYHSLAKKKNTYFYDKHFKIMTENIIPGHYQVFMNVMQMYTKEHLALFLI